MTLLYLIYGPLGSGKTTIADALFQFAKPASVSVREERVGSDEELSIALGQTGGNPMATVIVQCSGFVPDLVEVRNVVGAKVRIHTIQTTRIP